MHPWVPLIGSSGNKEENNDLKPLGSCVHDSVKYICPVLSYNLLFLICNIKYRLLLKILNTIKNRQPTKSCHI